MPAQSFDVERSGAMSAGSRYFLLHRIPSAAVRKPKAGQFYMLRAWAADEAPLLSRPISLHSF